MLGLKLNHASKSRPRSLTAMLLDMEIKEVIVFQEKCHLSVEKLKKNVKDILMFPQMNSTGKG